MPMFALLSLPAEMAAAGVNTRGVAVSRVSPGVLGKFLHCHHSKSPMSEAFISSLCPGCHSLADTLWPTWGHDGQRRRMREQSRAEGARERAVMP